MDNLIQAKATQLLQFLEKITGCNLKDLKGQTFFSGTLGAYTNAKDLFTIHNYIQNREYEIAYEKEITFLKNLIPNMRFSSKMDELIKDCEEMGHILLAAHGFFKDYAEWTSEERKHFREYLFNNEFLKEEEKTEEFLNHFNYEWIDLAKKSVQSKMLQLYNFGKVSDAVLKPGHTVPYFISDALCISDDINLCIGANKGSGRDECGVRLSLKIDPELAFSYFIITVQYKDRIWLVTDKPSFANPRSKQSTRNPYRWREEAFDNIYLPYNLLDNIEEWRKESKALARENSSETYIKSIRDFLPPTSKILLKLIIEELIYNVIPMKQYELQRIGFAGEHIKMIGSGQELKSVEDNTFIKVNKEANDERVNNIVYPASTELVKVNPAQAVAKYVEPGTLCTVEEMNKLAVWSQKEEQRRSKQQLLNEAYTRERMEADEELLNKLLFDNLENLYEVIFSADEVFMCIEDQPLKSFEYTSNSILQICNHSNFKSTYSSQYITNYHINKFRDFYSYARCIICDCEKPVNLQLRVFTYKQLCGMLKVARQDLPYTFQNYTTDAFLPYVGNTILDNVNPEYLILDPRSKTHRGYYSIGIPLNKRCFNKLRKKYWKWRKSLVIINYSKGTIKIEQYDNQTM